jgi:hypothetical protein
MGRYLPGVAGRAAVTAAAPAARSATVLLYALLVILVRFPLAAADVAGGGVVEESVAWLGVRVDPTRIADQQVHPGNNVCVPATLLNALRFGPADFQRRAAALPGATDKERIDGIIADAGSMPSLVEPGQPCYTDSGGVRAPDMPQMYGRLLAGAASAAPGGRYLDRVDKEDIQAQLRRIHGLLLASLAAGVPVVVSLNSIAASRADQGKEFMWHALAGHVVLIIALPRVVPPGALGFPMRFIDPWTASIQEGYVMGEVVRGCQAVKGSGSKDFVWLGNAFLQVAVPGLTVGTGQLPFYARSFITLNYAVGRFPAGPP